MKDILKNLWFEDINAPVLYINDTAMKIRAGIMLFIPIFVSFSLYDAFYVSNYVVDASTLKDTYDTNFNDQIVYTAEVVKRVGEYSTQTYVLLFAFFEMFVGIFKTTSRFSLLIPISVFLAKNYPIVYKPYTPKKFAWTLGSVMIAICLLFFNPDTFAEFINALFFSDILPTTYNYVPSIIPITLVWLCVFFMWLEAIFGFCVGCKIHSFLVFIKVLDDECVACNDIYAPRK
jgi:hypothetical protein